MKPHCIGKEFDELSTLETYPEGMLKLPMFRRLAYTYDLSRGGVERRDVENGLKHVLRHTEYLSQRDIERKKERRKERQDMHATGVERY